MATDALGSSLVKIIDPRLQQPMFRGGKCAHMRQFGPCGLKAQPFDFDLHAIGDQREMRQARREGLQAIRLPIVVRRERGEVHGIPLKDKH